MDIQWVVSSVIIAILTFLVGLLGNKLNVKIQKEIREDEAIKNGMRCLLREQIIAICDRCIERGSVHLHSLESLDDLFTQYERLGGNGTIKKLVKDIKSMHVTK